MNIGEWLDAGKPKNVWFTIRRDQELTQVDENTPAILAKLIITKLAGYGLFETRLPSWCLRAPFLHADYHIFTDSNNRQFYVKKTAGTVNGLIVPVVAMYAEARIFQDIEYDDTQMGV